MLPERTRNICESCENGFLLLNGKHCLKCSRLSDETICSDCVKWENDPTWQGVLSFNQSVYSYNPMLRDVVTKWKYRGDYLLRDIFQYTFKDVFDDRFVKWEKEAIIVPIPLSEERMLERGFNQAESLAQLLKLPYQKPLSRVHGEKQSKKTRKERIDSKNPFEIKVQVSHPVILIDDIYTTGMTLRHAAKLLKNQGCPEVFAFTLARG
nr:ComF family protein [Aquibacillus halophilus]